MPQPVSHRQRAAQGGLWNLTLVEYAARFLCRVDQHRVASGADGGCGRYLLAGTFSFIKGFQTHVLNSFCGWLVWAQRALSWVPGVFLVRKFPKFLRAVCIFHARPLAVFRACSCAIGPAPHFSLRVTPVARRRFSIAIKLRCTTVPATSQWHISDFFFYPASQPASQKQFI